MLCHFPDWHIIPAEFMIAFKGNKGKPISTHILAQIREPFKFLYAIVNMKHFVFGANLNAQFAGVHKTGKLSVIKQLCGIKPCPVSLGHFVLRVKKEQEIAARI